MKKIGENMFSKILKEADSISSIISVLVAIIIATGALHSLSMNIMFPGSIYLLNANDMINMSITGLPITLNVILLITPLIYINYRISYSRRLMTFSVTIVLLSIAITPWLLMIQDNYSNVETGLLILFAMCAQSFYISMASKYFKTFNSSLSSIAYLLPLIYFAIAALLFYVLKEIITETSEFFKIGDSFVCTETCERGDIISSLGEFLVVEYKKEAVVSYVRREDIKKYYIVRVRD
jgi:hypothetical protein